jgi:D-cysteine desulfhydrase
MLRGVPRSPLQLRFPSLDLPRLPFAAQPSPVVELGGLLVFDDRAHGTVWGGNKPRKLAWLLADALASGRQTLVTAGGLATHHGLATALYGAEHGLATTLLLVDQPLDDHARETYARIRASGARLVHAHGPRRALLLAPWVLATARRPYLIPVGGSSPLGVLGAVEAGLEMADALAGREVSRVVVAYGSGGSAAGAALGLRLAGLEVPVTAVLVNDQTRTGVRRLAALADKALGLLRAHGADVGDVQVDPGWWELRTEWLGAGYGHRTAAGDAAMERLPGLEPVYTAKAAAAALTLPGPVLLWHTQSGIG